MLETDIEAIRTELSKLKQNRKDTKLSLMKLLESKATPVQNEVLLERFKPGPVGESPVHDCFLLGLTDIGMEIIDLYYANSSSINVAYKNDLRPLQKDEAENSDRTNQDSSEEEREYGLYTGETLLHIAIVKEDVEMVVYLLQQGIEVSSRATGVFFQPKWIRPHVKDLTLWQRFLSWIAGVDLNLEKFTGVSQEKNDYSACYYGEYPLSFAASVGSVEICKLLFLHIKNTEALCDSNTVQRAGKHSYPNNIKEAMDKFCRLGKSQTFSKHNKHWNSNSNQLLSEFVNAVDYFGNTALHMAVLHRKMDVIDWLMTTEVASLEILNYDGFTPLTYAARLGYVDIYNHILFKHLSRTGWTYGKVRS